MTKTLLPHSARYLFVGLALLSACSDEAQGNETPGTSEDELGFSAWCEFRPTGSRCLTLPGQFCESEVGLSAGEHKGRRVRLTSEFGNNFKLEYLSAEGKVVSEYDGRLDGRKRFDDDLEIRAPRASDPFDFRSEEKARIHYVLDSWRTNDRQWINVDGETLPAKCNLAEGVMGM